MEGQIVKTIKMDLANNTCSPSEISVMQYSYSLCIVVAELYNGSEAYTIPDGSTVRTRWNKPDGSIVYKPVTAWSGNTVTYRLDEQCARASGRCAACFEIDAGSSGIMQTPKFGVACLRNPVQGSDVANSTADGSTIPELGEMAAAYTDIEYNKKARAVTSVAEMDSLFVEWWHLAEKLLPNATKSELLERFFGTVLDDERVHGVKLPLFGTSETAIGELTDDSAGLVCEPSTEETAGQDDFAFLPQFWCLEVSAEKNTDGSHTIYYVEHIDSYSDVRGGEHLCWVLQKNTFTREWDSDGYRLFKMRCHAAPGYEQWPQGTDRTNKTHAYIANPKYAAGLDANGLITCGTGLAPVNYTSHNGLVSLWRKRGTQYSGASGNLLKWQLAMIWLKYARKGNSGTIEGCSNYNYQYTAAVSETGVQRILLTTAQAANLHAGSNVIIGNKGTGTSADRGVSSMHSICKNKRIKSITEVTVSGTTYAAVTIDNGGTTFDTVAGETYISTMPYYSGWNDNVQGFDGSKYSPTSGKEPGLIQKTEFQNGAYVIISDELWQWGQDADGDYTFDCFVCHDQSKVTTNGTISSDYTKQDELTLTFAADYADGWSYIEDTAIASDRGVVWPKSVSTKAGSGTGCKAGFYVGKAASGVRAAWCCCHLDSNGGAGLPARASSCTAAHSPWNGGGGSPGLAG